MIDKTDDKCYNLQKIRLKWTAWAVGGNLKELCDVYDARGEKIPGRMTERGKHALGKGEYHLVVFAWIINDKNEFIISRRQKGKSFAGKWECTCGCALAGEDSLRAAMREVSEELGLSLDAEKGEFFKRYRRNYPEGARALCDVWVFRGNFDISDMKLQKEEVSEAKLISSNDLLEFFGKGTYKKRYEYLPELVEKYTK